MYKHILIPTDGSTLSAHAATDGVALAKATGARVTGLFVAPAPTPLVFEGLLPVALHAARGARRADRAGGGALPRRDREGGISRRG